MTQKPKTVIPPSGRSPLSGRNSEQIEYIRALKRNDQVFALGPAGTGKTYISTAYGADLLLDGTVEQFRICRPNIGTEKMGFLPGDADRKMAPWMWPVIDVLEERLGKTNVKALMDKQDPKIIFEPFEFMQGRTFKNSYVVLDEAQNTTVTQMKCFLTRIGEGSRVVVSGDLRQSLYGTNNGLHFALGLIALLKMPVPVVYLKEVERSGPCAMWVNAFEDQFLDT